MVVGGTVLVIDGVVVVVGSGVVVVGFGAHESLILCVVRPDVPRLFGHVAVTLSPGDSANVPPESEAATESPVNPPSNSPTAEKSAKALARDFIAWFFIRLPSNY